MTDPTDFLDRLSGKRAAMNDEHGLALEYPAARSIADNALDAYVAWSRACRSPAAPSFNMDPQKSSGRWSGDDGALLGDNHADAEMAADAALDAAEHAADRPNACAEDAMTEDEVRDCFAGSSGRRVSGRSRRALQVGRARRRTMPTCRASPG